MNNKIMSSIMCLSLLSLIACNNGGGGGGEPSTPLGKATQPGYFPDGTKAQPLTTEQKVEFFNKLGEANTVQDSVSKVSQNHQPKSENSNLSAEVQSNSNPSAPSTIPTFNADSKKAEKLSQDIESKCTFSQSGNLPKVQPGLASQNMNAKYSVKGAGTKCPVDFIVETEMNGAINVNEAAKTANGSVTSSMTSTVIVKDELAAKELKAKEVGSKFNFGMSINGSQQAISMSMNGTASQVATLIQDGADYKLEGQILFTAGYNGKSSNGNGPDQMNGTMKMALVYKLPGFQALFQVFMTETNGKKTNKAYINGEEAPMESSTQVKAILASPAVQTFLDHAALSN